MAAFFSNNWGTILIGAIVAGILAAIVAKALRDSRKGKCVGCSCGSCPNQSGCNTK